MNVLLKSFLFESQTIGFHPQTQRLQPLNESSSFFLGGLEDVIHQGRTRSEEFFISYGVTQRQFLENVCSEDDLRSRIFGTFVVKFLACLPLLGFSNI